MAGKKDKETYEKVSETFKKKGDTAWSKAKRGEGDHNYNAAKRFYETSKKAKKIAEEL